MKPIGFYHNTVLYSYCGGFCRDHDLHVYSTLVDLKKAIDYDHRRGYCYG